MTQALASGDPVNVLVNARLTTDEQTELDAWIRTRGNDLITKVTIESGRVTLHSAGLGHVMSAMAVHYPRRLTGALDEALSNLYNAP